MTTPVVVVELISQELSKEVSSRREDSLTWKVNLIKGNLLEADDVKGLSCTIFNQVNNVSWRRRCFTAMILIKFMKSCHDMIIELFVSNLLFMNGREWITFSWKTRQIKGQEKLIQFVSSQVYHCQWKPEKCKCKRTTTPSSRRITKEKHTHSNRKIVEIFASDIYLLHALLLSKPYLKSTLIPSDKKQSRT